MGDTLHASELLSEFGLHFESTYRLLVCLDCEVALTSQSAATHFRNIHHDSRLKISKPQLDAACAQLDVSTQMPTDLWAIPAIPGLRMFTDALLCGVQGCCKVYSTQLSMCKHYRDEHPSTPIPANWTVVFAQRLDNGSHNRLFKVEPPSSSSLEAHAGKDWVMQLYETIDNLTQVPNLAPNDPRSLTPWLRSTGWPSHVLGHTKSHLRRLVSYPLDSEFPWLRPAMLALYERSASLIEGTPVLALQKLNTPDPQKT